MDHTWNLTMHVDCEFKASLGYIVTETVTHTSNTEETLLSACKLSRELQRFRFHE